MALLEHVELTKMQKLLRKQKPKRKLIFILVFVIVFIFVVVFVFTFVFVEITIRIGKICKEIPCYMCDSPCRWRIVKNILKIC